MRLVGRKEGIKEGSVVAFWAVVKHSEQNSVPLDEVLLALDDLHLLECEDLAAEEDPDKTSLRVHVIDEEVVPLEDTTLELVVVAHQLHRLPVSCVQTTE